MANSAIEMLSSLLESKEIKGEKNFTYVTFPSFVHLILLNSKIPYDCHIPVARILLEYIRRTVKAISQYKRDENYESMLCAITLPLPELFDKSTPYWKCFSENQAIYVQTMIESRVKGVSQRDKEFFSSKGERVICTDSAITDLQFLTNKFFALDGLKMLTSIVSDADVVTTTQLFGAILSTLYHLCCIAPSIAQDVIPLVLDVFFEQFLPLLTADVAESPDFAAVYRTGVKFRNCVESTAKWNLDEFVFSFAHRLLLEAPLQRRVKGLKLLSAFCGRTVAVQKGKALFTVFKETLFGDASTKPKSLQERVNAEMKRKLPIPFPMLYRDTDISPDWLKKRFKEIGVLRIIAGFDHRTLLQQSREIVLFCERAKLVKADDVRLFLESAEHAHEAEQEEIYGMLLLLASDSKLGAVMKSATKDWNANEISASKMMFVTKLSPNYAYTQLAGFFFTRGVALQQRCKIGLALARLLKQGYSKPQLFLGSCSGFVESSTCQQDTLGVLTTCKTVMKQFPSAMNDSVRTSFAGKCVELMTAALEHDFECFSTEFAAAWDLFVLFMAKGVAIPHDTVESFVALLLNEEPQKSDAVLGKFAAIDILQAASCPFLRSFAPPFIEQMSKCNMRQLSQTAFEALKRFLIAEGIASKKFSMHGAPKVPFGELADFHPFFGAADERFLLFLNALFLKLIPESGAIPMGSVTLCSSLIAAYVAQISAKVSRVNKRKEQGKTPSKSANERIALFLGMLTKLLLSLDSCRRKGKQKECAKSAGSACQRVSVKIAAEREPKAPQKKKGKQRRLALVPKTPTKGVAPAQPMKAKALSVHEETDFVSIDAGTSFEEFENRICDCVCRHVLKAKALPTSVTLPGINRVLKGKVRSMQVSGKPLRKEKWPGDLLSRPSPAVVVELARFDAGDLVAEFCRGATAPEVSILPDEASSYFSHEQGQRAKKGHSVRSGSSVLERLLSADLLESLYALVIDVTNAVGPDEDGIDSTCLSLLFLLPAKMLGQHGLDAVGEKTLTALMADSPFDFYLVLLSSSTDGALLSRFERSDVLGALLDSIEAESARDAEPTALSLRKYALALQTLVRAVTLREDADRKESDAVERGKQIIGERVDVLVTLLGKYAARSGNASASASASLIPDVLHLLFLCNVSPSRMTSELTALLFDDCNSSRAVSELLLSHAHAAAEQTEGESDFIDTVKTIVTGGIRDYLEKRADAAHNFVAFVQKLLCLPVARPLYKPVLDCSLELFDTHGTVERSGADLDVAAAGVLDVIWTVFAHSPELLREEGRGILFVLAARYLFSRSPPEFFGGKLLPICKSPLTRALAFRLLGQIAEDRPYEVAECVSEDVQNSLGGHKGLRGVAVGGLTRVGNNGFCGLRNQGATCYLNSTIQQLFHIAPFRNGVLRLPTELLPEDRMEENEGADASGEDDGERQSGEKRRAALLRKYNRAKVDLGMVLELRRMFAFLAYDVGGSYDTRGFCATVKDDTGAPIHLNQQMDANEFFNMTMDRIETALHFMDKRKTAFVNDLLGHFQTEIVSTDCDDVSQRRERFFTVELEIKGKPNIAASLESFIAKDMLTDDNKYFCGKCEKKVNAFKRTLFKDLPNVLILHLKRFDFDMERMTNVKLNDYCEFPMTLDMSPYTVLSVHQREAQHDDRGNDVGESSADTQYDLVGVIVQSGGASSGHYYTLRKVQATQQWFKFNDSTVTPFNPADIPTECFGGVFNTKGRVETRSNNAYILFYQKKTFVVSDEALPPASLADDLKEPLLDSLYRRMFSGFITDDAFKRFAVRLSLSKEVESLDEEQLEKVVCFCLTALYRATLSTSTASAEFTELSLAMEAGLKRNKDYHRALLRVFSEEAFLLNSFLNSEGVECTCMCYLLGEAVRAVSSMEERNGSVPLCKEFAVLDKESAKEGGEDGENGENDAAKELDCDTTDERENGDVEETSSDSESDASKRKERQAESDDADEVSVFSVQDFVRLLAKTLACNSTANNKALSEILLAYAELGSAQRKFLTDECELLPALIEPFVESGSGKNTSPTWRYSSKKELFAPMQLLHMLLREFTLPEKSDDDKQDSSSKTDGSHGKSHKRKHNKKQNILANEIVDKISSKVYLLLCFILSFLFFYKIYLFKIFIYYVSISIK